MLNAAVAKIFGGSLPEKIARCLGFYYKIKPLSDLKKGALLFEKIKQKIEKGYRSGLLLC
ncbi:MAG: hypothetical protein EAZ60_10095 [Oscillatoriales cyanobacterium]|nr:MAG: hypothetical protein EAZ83_10565 [Oscillatoriales cyanobacterium]TAF20413.1 MAG: hypothetical protein EAZ73_12475 [Oscillatoriales cyanobacterium]TAF34029.1 MAG: hypothetical protein EAZ69_15490 [Oscillatoriales cyanobacterium]TAF56373.1 MAG: hypothetical protein EAZ60_10095 [Oscillatoriales cyanobacterium]